MTNNRDTNPYSYSRLNKTAVPVHGYMKYVFGVFIFRMYICICRNEWLCHIEWSVIVSSRWHTTALIITSDTTLPGMTSLCTFRHLISSEPALTETNVDVMTTRLHDYLVTVLLYCLAKGGSFQGTTRWLPWCLSSLGTDKTHKGNFTRVKCSFPRESHR